MAKIDLRRIALLEDVKGNDILLLLYKGKLSYVKTMFNLNISDEELIRNYTITSYKDNYKHMLNIVYNDCVIEINESYCGSGCYNTTITKDVVMVHTNIISNWFIRSGCLYAVVNTGSLQAPEFIDVVIKADLDNYVTYNNNSSVVVLNKIPHEIKIIY